MNLSETFPSNIPGLSEVGVGERFILVKNLHNVMTGELVFEDVVSDWFGDHKNIALEQAEIWNSERYPEYQNVRVFKVTTTMEQV